MPKILCALAVGSCGRFLDGLDTVEVGEGRGLAIDEICETL